MLDRIACTDRELMTVLSARSLKDGEVVFAGIGIPLLAACLAQKSHAPGLTILFEGGVIGAAIEPGWIPPSTNDQRGAHRSNMVLGSTEVLLLLQRGHVDVGFVGGAQIDPYGNLNSSLIRATDDKPAARLPGSGGGNDIASLTDLIVTMKHERRRFVEKVEFITSPGWLRGGTSRHDSGLTLGGPWRVITDLAILGFAPDTKRMRVEALHPGVTREHIQAQTGFKLDFADNVTTTEAPRAQELALLRALDTERLLTG